MRKFNLFNFLEKKVEVADINTVTAKMLEQVAFRELATHIAISYIANTISKCEFKVFEDGAETKNNWYYLLNVSPNANQNSSQFINQFIENYYYHGHALVVPHNNQLYCADSFDIDDTNPLKENIFYNVSFNSQQLKKKYKASEVFYFKLDNQNVKNLVDLVYQQYGEVFAIALQTYKRTNGKKYKLLLEQYRAGDPAFAQAFETTIKKQLQTFMENDSAVYPQFKGTDLQEFSGGGNANTDDIVAMRKEIFDTTAQAFKIPLSMMQGNITNMQEIVKVYLSFCIDPLADMIGEELTRKTNDFDTWNSGKNFIKVDTGCINHIDLLEIAEAVDKLIASGFASIDELRAITDMQPLNTEFSTSHFLTKNYDLAENMLNSNSDEGGV